MKHIFPKLRISNARPESGMTLLEMMVAMGIAGSIGTATFTQSFNISQHAEHTVNRLTAVNSVRALALSTLERTDFVNNAGESSEYIKNCVDGTGCHHNEQIAVEILAGTGNEARPIIGTAEQPVYYSSRGMSCGRVKVDSCMLGTRATVTPVCINDCGSTDRPNMLRFTVTFFDASLAGDNAADPAAVLSEFNVIKDLESFKETRMAEVNCPLDSGFVTNPGASDPKGNAYGQNRAWSFQTIATGFANKKLVCNYKLDPNNANLAGEPGAKGDKGEKGPQGDKGPTGDRGQSRLVKRDNPNQSITLTAAESIALGKLRGPSQIIDFNGDAVSVINVAGRKSSFGRIHLSDWATRGGGCFAEGTLIKMADGSRKKIEETVRGEFVWNGVNGTPIQIDYGVRGPELKPMFALHFGKEVVTVTEGHPMFTKRGLIQAKELVASDLVLWEDGSYKKMDKLEQTKPSKDAMVYNLYLKVPVSAEPKDSEVVAGPGLVTGDLRTQQNIAKAEASPGT